VLGKPGSVTELDLDDVRGMQLLGMPQLGEASKSTAPIANGSNGETIESHAGAAPNANGSNGGKPISMGPPAPSGLGPKADQWLDRQMRLTMEALGKEPLLKGL
jgi:hypothetical protein